MAEVFTIAGAPHFGAASCPAGWTRTPRGNCGGTPPSYRHPAASALQAALTVIARATGDASLNVKNDGIIGPITTAAVNKAMTAHVGPGQAPAALRSGALAIGDVSQNAPALVQALNAEAARRGTGPGPGPGPVPTPNIVAETAPGVLWALVGLNLVLTGVGFYAHYSGRPVVEEEERPRRRALRAKALAKLRARHAT